MGMSRITGVCLVPDRGGKDAGQHFVYGRGLSCNAIIAFQLWILAARALTWKMSHVLTYHMYFIPSDVQLKVAKLFAYGDSLTAEGDLRRSKMQQRSWKNMSERVTV